ncbi:unnamed protein product [Eretmochelys imbricata]
MHPEKRSFKGFVILPHMVVQLSKLTSPAGSRDLTRPSPYLLKALELLQCVCAALQNPHLQKRKTHTHTHTQTLAKQEALDGRLVNYINRARRIVKNIQGDEHNLQY